MTEEVTVVVVDEVFLIVSMAVTVDAIGAAVVRVGAAVDVVVNAAEMPTGSLSTAGAMLRTKLCRIAVISMAVAECIRPNCDGCVVAAELLPVELLPPLPVVVVVVVAGAANIFCPADMFEWKFLNLESSTDVESERINGAAVAMAVSNVDADDDDAVGATNGSPSR